jgi:hypothetical protein
MPLQATSGAASYDAFGGGVPVVPQYIEDVFSTYLYTGNAGTQTVTNGIDLSTKGGMVWTKSRSNSYAHSIMDTVRGFNYSGTQTRRLDPSTTDNEADSAGNATQATPLSDGFSITTSGGGAINFYNASGATYASWTFREQPKFFDIVTWSGDGTGARTISHSLGSTPACIIMRSVNTADNWAVFHRGMTSPNATWWQNYMLLDQTQAAGNYATSGLSAEPTSTTFSVGSGFNTSGKTLIAYIFAHDAGGFGLTGTDNVISCGSYTTGASGAATVTLGYEPQWILLKNTTDPDKWYILDNMRGWGMTQANGLYPNVLDAESDAFGNGINPTATGFKDLGVVGTNATIIYIAIRRGPMKVPTLGTSVFSPIAASSGTQTTGFPVDMQILSYRSGTDAFLNHQVIDRLRGVSSTSTAQGNYLNTTSTAAQSNVDPYSSINMTNTGFNVGNNYAGTSSVFHSFGRAPSFFDEVCYTGTGSVLTIDHNLQATPELIIIKRRNGTAAWVVYSSSLGFNSYRFLNDLSSATTPYLTGASSTTFTLNSGGYTATNSSGNTYVAYLFSTCAGVSKVGNYTGTGSTQTINCGFTSGARFVLIKRTDADTGNWFVWDTARGMVSGTDPRLALNTTAAESNADWVYTTTSGFEIVTSDVGVNTSGGSYIFLAIA